MDGMTRFHRFRYYLAHGFVSSDDIVLDLGCGTGYGSRILSETALEVRGYDMEPSNIDYARIHHVAFNNLFEVANLEEMRMPKADIAVSFEVIEHLYNPKKFVDKLKKKIGKFIIVSVPLDQRLVMVDGDPQEEGDKTHHSVFTQPQFMELFIDDKWKEFFSFRDGVTLIAIFYKI